MIQVNRIYLIFNRLVTKKFLVETSEIMLIKIIDNGFKYIKLQKKYITLSSISSKNKKTCGIAKNTIYIKNVGILHFRQPECF